MHDILERADVSRSTFYAHFIGKHDAEVSTVAELREQLLVAARAEPSFALGLFRFAAQHRPLLQAAIGRQPCFGQVRSLIEEAIRRSVDVARPGLPESHIQTLAAAFIGLLCWSLEARNETPPEELARTYHAIVRLPAGIN